MRSPRPREGASGTCCSHSLSVTKLRLQSCPKLIAWEQLNIRHSLQMVGVWDAREGADTAPEQPFVLPGTLRVFHYVLCAPEPSASPACTHASLFVLERRVPMNSGKQKALPIHPKQAFQAGLGTCQSVINLPVTVTGAFRRLAGPGQVDLVSKLGFAVTPWGLAGGWALGGEKLLRASKPQQILPPAGEGTRQSDTLAEPIWHTREQLTLLPIFHGAS